MKPEARRWRLLPPVPGTADSIATDRRTYDWPDSREAFSGIDFPAGTTITFTSRHDEKSITVVVGTQDVRVVDIHRAHKAATMAAFQVYLSRGIPNLSAYGGTVTVLPPCNRSLRLDADTGEEDLDSHGARRSITGNHLVPRLGRTKEIAAAVCFLASDNALFVNGVAWNG